MSSTRIFRLTGDPSDQIRWIDNYDDVTLKRWFDENRLRDIITDDDVNVVDHDKDRENLLQFLDGIQHGDVHNPAIVTRVITRHFRHFPDTIGNINGHRNTKLDQAAAKIVEAGVNMEFTCHHGVCGCLHKLRPSGIPHFRMTREGDNKIPSVRWIDENGNTTFMVIVYGKYAGNVPVERRNAYNEQFPGIMWAVIKADDVLEDDGSHQFSVRFAHKKTEPSRVCFKCIKKIPLRKRINEWACRAREKVKTKNEEKRKREEERIWQEKQEREREEERIWQEKRERRKKEEERIRQEEQERRKKEEERIRQERQERLMWQEERIRQEKQNRLEHQRIMKLEVEEMERKNKEWQARRNECIVEELEIRKKREHVKNEMSRKPAEDETIEAFNIWLKEIEEKERKLEEKLPSSKVKTLHEQAKFRREYATVENFPFWKEKVEQLHEILTRY